MKTVYICFNLKSISCAADDNCILEKDYDYIYKPLVQFLYAHNDFPFSFSLNGNILFFLRNRKTEIITLLKQLIENKQIEILGGGFYEPILPLIYPADRNGQIDLLSTEIRHSLGRRPRGITLHSDIWDSTLVNNIHTCGIEYVLLDSSLIPDNKQSYLPLIMNDLGKSVDIFPYYKNLVPTPNMEAKDFINMIKSEVIEAEKHNSLFQNVQNRVVTINLNHEEMYHLLQNNWFSKLYLELKNEKMHFETIKSQLEKAKIDYEENRKNLSSLLKGLELPFEDEAITKEKLDSEKEILEESIIKFGEEIKEYTEVSITTPYYFRKDNKYKLPAFIPAGLNENVSKYIVNPFKVTPLKNKNRYTIFDFMETYYQSQNLYSRMIYVSMLVNQYKADKQRKKSARDLLWKAQNGNSLVWSEKDITKNLKTRQKAYKQLMAADLIIREGSKFKSTLTSFDYNGDGLNEYVCRMNDFFAVISLLGGCLQDLEVEKNTGNYADNMSRILSFDGVNDNYRRGIFIDHLLTNKQFNQYVMNEGTGDGVFAKVTYNEKNCKLSNRYICLDASATLKNGISVYLQKTYIINDSGIQVGYVIRNNSDKVLQTTLAIESNFACLNYTGKDMNYYKLEVVANNESYYINDDKKLVYGNKSTINNKIKSSEENTESENKEHDNLLNDVSVIRVNDIENEMSFTFEPNEQCGFCFNTIEYKREDYKGESHNVEKSFVATLFWDINLDPGKETEKNISFLISPTKIFKTN